MNWGFFEFLFFNYALNRAYIIKLSSKSFGVLERTIVSIFYVLWIEILDVIIFSIYSGALWRNSSFSKDFWMTYNWELEKKSL